MQKTTKYVIFRTKWGYFGLAGTEYALCRTCLPGPSPEKLKSHLLKTLLLQHRASLILRSFSEGGSIEFDKAFFKPIQEQIAAYFENVCVNFGPDIPVSLDGFSEFQKAVLAVCRDVFFGQIITYIELARKSGRPSAPRAVGNALANNPLPLIIPCHRVIRSDGSLGGFSGLGGLSLKRKLLAHEQDPLSATVLLHHPQPKPDIRQARLARHCTSWRGRDDGHRHQTTRTSMGLALETGLMKRLTSPAQRLRLFYPAKISGRQH